MLCKDIKRSLSVRPFPREALVWLTSTQRGFRGSRVASLVGRGVSAMLANDDGDVDVSLVVCRRRCRRDSSAEMPTLYCRWVAVRRRCFSHHATWHAGSDEIRPRLAASATHALRRGLSGGGDLRRSCLRSQIASCLPIGRLRIRFPVAAKIALMRAGAKGGTPGSPAPLGGSPASAGMM